MAKRLSNERYEEREAIIVKIMETHSSICFVFQLIRKLINRETKDERHKKGTVL